MDGSSQIKGVLFDLDGTLYRMKWLMKPLLMFRVFPNSLRLPRFLKIRGKYAGLDLYNRNNLLKSICDELASIENCSPEELRSWILNSFYPGFIYTMKFQKNGRPGINQTLQGLRDRKIQLAVLSDYNSVKERLNNLDINAAHFSITTSCEASGALKPSPRPFLQIAQKWGISPEELLVVGDRDDTDGAAARSAGMNFIQICEKKSPSKEILNWNELRKQLEHLQGPPPVL
ncbi:MAG: HAD family hydrolase [Chitinispirillaceae bacterium]|nr:HAD family hydrolase [Chitinispirillaceae bacterium]